jgi:hypothetical protein
MKYISALKNKLNIFLNMIGGLIAIRKNATIEMFFRMLIAQRYLGYYFIDNVCFYVYVSNHKG